MRFTRKERASQVNRLFYIMEFSVLSLKARNRPVGITGKYRPTVSHSERALDQLQTRTI